MIWIKEWLYSLKSDKLLHFIVALVIAQAGAAVFGLFMGRFVRIYMGWLLAVIVTLLKEIWDKRHDGVCSKADFAAGFLGALVGAAMLLIAL